jgi:hypothetical protein
MKTSPVVTAHPQWYLKTPELDKVPGVAATRT